MPSGAKPLVLALAALFVMGTSWALLCLPGKRQAAESPIQRVADLDAYHFREIRAHQQLWDPTKAEDIQKIIELGRTYQKATQAIDLAQCPAAFRQAYRKHNRGWAQVLDNLETALQSQSASDREELGSRVRQATKPLAETWSEVVSAAKASGVYLSN